MNMKNSKKAWIIFRRCLFILFIIFLINYFSVSTGYYKEQINKKTVLTDEKIKEFEEDVKNGEYVDINDYVVEDYVDTSNFISKATNKCTSFINNIITDKAVKIFRALGKLFT